MGRGGEATGAGAGEVGLLQCQSVGHLCSQFFQLTGHWSQFLLHEEGQSAGQLDLVQGVQGWPHLVPEASSSLPVLLPLVEGEGM